MRIIATVSLYVLIPESPDEREWVETFIQDAEGTYNPDFPNRVIVEHRYIRPIIDGMVADGIEVHS